MTQAVVAGVSGLLGREIAGYLAAESGFAVRGVARSAGELATLDRLERQLPGVQLELADLQDPIAAEKLVAGADLVVFCAGRSGVVPSFADPGRDLTETAMPVLSVLQHCRSGAHLVLISSQLVYGLPSEPKVSEASPLSPQSPYAAHRVLIESYGRLLGPAHGVGVTALRLGNVFGPVHDVDYRRTHGIVPAILKNLVHGRPVPLYGGGDQMVDMLHASDLARAIARVAKAPAAGFSVYNLHGSELAVAAVAGALATHFPGARLEPVDWPSPQHEAMARNIELDDRSFRSEFGWSPAVNVIEELQNMSSHWSART